jgi:hypothetical protein
MKPGIEVHSLEKEVAEKMRPAGHFLVRGEAQRPGEQLVVVTSVFWSTKVGEQQREERNYTGGAHRAIFDQMSNNQDRKPSKDGRQCKLAVESLDVEAQY